MSSPYLGRFLACGSGAAAANQRLNTLTQQPARFKFRKSRSNFLAVFPRFAGDGFGLKFSRSYFMLPPRAELDDIAKGIRDAMSD
jgi:hypothetical protein